MNKTEATRGIFGFTRGDSNPNLPLLSQDQEEHVTNILIQLDEADAFYDNKELKQFLAGFENARVLHERSSALLPLRDIRLNLLNSTLDAYKNVGVLVFATFLGKYDESPDAMVAAGRMRKAFLRMIIENKLDTEAQSLLAYLLGR